MLCFILLFLSLMSGAFANPSGAFIIEGDVSIQKPTNDQLVISSNSDLTIIHWDQFNIKAGESTHFNLPSPESAIINRDIPGIPSHILGDLHCNGSLILINPTGITIGDHGTISANHLLATTLDIEDDLLINSMNNEKSGYCQLEGVNGLLENGGSITTENGDITLLSNNIINKGTINAKDGSVYIGAAPKLLLYNKGNQRIIIRPNTTQDSSFTNTGKIFSNSCEIAACANPFSSAINLSGSITTVGDSSQDMGSIRITTEGDIAFDGYTYGSLDAAAENILVTKDASIDASHSTHPGNINIFGSSKVYVSDGALLSTQANVKGDGGDINLIANIAVVQGGYCKSCGGPEGGHGGNIELSGKKHVAWPGSFSRQAPHPDFSPGKFIIDPESDITLSYREDYNYNILDQNWVPTFDSMNVNVNSLIQELNNGPVIISTTFPVGPQGEGSIHVEPQVRMLYNTPYSLTFKCFGDKGIILDGQIANSGLGSIHCTCPNGPLFIHGAISTLGDISIGSKVNPIGGSISLTPIDKNVSLMCQDNGSLSLCSESSVEIISNAGGAAQLTSQAGNISLISGKHTTLKGDEGRNVCLKTTGGSIFFEGIEEGARPSVTMQAETGQVQCLALGKESKIHFNHLEDISIKANKSPVILTTANSDLVIHDVTGNVFLDAGQSNASLSIGGNIQAHIGSNLFLQASEQDASIYAKGSQNWSIDGDVFFYGDKGKAQITGESPATISVQDSFLLAADNERGAGIDTETLLLFVHGDLLMDSGAFLGQNTQSLSVSVDGKLRLGGENNHHATSSITAGSIEIATIGPIELNASSSITSLTSTLKLSSGSIIELRDNSVVAATKGDVDIRSLTTHVTLTDQALLESREGSVNIIAKDSIFLLDKAKIISQGPLGTNLVCDFGKQLGSGRFVLARNAKVNTSNAPLNVFSSTQALNRIDGTLNDVNYNPTPTYFTNREEVWGVNYIGYDTPQPLNIDPITQTYPLIKYLEMPQQSPYNMFYQSQSLISVGQDFLSNQDVVSLVTAFIGPARQELFRDLNNYDAFITGKTQFYVKSSSRLPSRLYPIDSTYFCPKFTIHYINPDSPYLTNLPKTREKIVNNL